MNVTMAAIAMQASKSISGMIGKAPLSVQRVIRFGAMLCKIVSVCEPA